MSGVTPLVDTLLATRLGQRVDLVPLKAQVEIAGPSAVANVEEVDIDVRLPSREALQRQLGVDLAGRDGGPPGFAQARADGAVTLSAAARTVSALLDLPVGTTPAVRGRAPLQPDMRAPMVPVLTATLARTVAESGLFYESHLQQYATGQRTLTQLAREPQAGLSSKAGPALETLEMAAPPAAGMAAPDAGSTEAPAPGGPLASPADKTGRPEPAGPATTYGRTGLPDHVPPTPHDFPMPDPGTPGPELVSVDTVRAGHPVAAIHPDVVGLVRQQLDMLAVPVFRWSGEGWPGIPMDWEIRQARDEQDSREGREGSTAEGDTEPSPSVWTTRMTLKLPRLGTVDVHLGLAGATLQLRLNASEDSTVAVLNQACAELPKRFGAVGLELTKLQIGGAAPKAGAADPAENDDAE